MILVPVFRLAARDRFNLRLVPIMVLVTVGSQFAPKIQHSEATSAISQEWARRYGDTRPIRDAVLDLISPVALSLNCQVTLDAADPLIPPES
jgi:hypothetical protein